MKLRYIEAMKLATKQNTKKNCDSIKINPFQILNT